MSRPLDHLRVDHIGSLLRPEALKTAFRDNAVGKLADGDLVRAQDEAIRAVVAKQEAHGLPVVTDGEYRRLNWQVSFSEVEGWDLSAVSRRAFLGSPDNRMPGEQALTRGEDAVLTYRTPATSKLRLARNFPLFEYQFAQGLTRRPAKAMIMGPDRVVQMFDAPGSRAVYPDTNSFMADVVRVQHEMAKGLAAAGCRYVQLDEPSYTGYVDPPTVERMRAGGDDPIALLDRAIAATNAVTAGLDLTVGVHICRGNRASMWHREGTYDAIAEKLFNGLACGRLLLEYDSERAGTFAPLRFVPKGKVAVLGLITTKHGRVETVEELKRRIDDAARHLPLDQLALSPQCGFASGIGGNLLSEDEQWRKLDVMLETARQVWGGIGGA